MLHARLLVEGLASAFSSTSPFHNSCAPLSASLKVLLRSSLKLELRRRRLPILFFHPSTSGPVGFSLGLPSVKGESKADWLRPSTSECMNCSIALASN